MGSHAAGRGCPTSWRHGTSFHTSFHTPSASPAAPHWYSEQSVQHRGGAQQQAAVVAVVRTPGVLHCLGMHSQGTVSRNRATHVSCLLAGCFRDSTARVPLLPQCKGSTVRAQIRQYEGQGRRQWGDSPCLRLLALAPH